MRKFKRKTILKEAVVLLIAAVMVSSAATVTANTVNDQASENMFSKLGVDYTPQPLTKMEETIPSTVELRDIILFESFEDTWVADSDGDLAPPGWENHITDFTDTGSPYYLPHYWGQYGTVTSYTPPAVPPDGDYQAMVQWSYNHQDEWLITPLLDLSGYENCEVTFWRYGHTGSTYGDHYYVKASPTGGFDKADFTDTLWDATDLPAGDNYYDTPYNIDLSAYDGTSFRLAWHNEDPPSNDGLWYGSCIDAVEVIAEESIPPLVADADGPYEAFEEEPIQFQGSAEGGVPPYSFHWDFGNGDTSDDEDPVYAYDEPGQYQVTLTVTDDAQTTDDDETTATINELPCCYEVSIPKGFGIGLKAQVTEICQESHTGEAWRFYITGGLFIPISPLTGTADFAAGETKTIKAPLVIGLGSIKIAFTIGEYCDTITENALIIGPLVIVI